MTFKLDASRPFIIAEAGTCHAAPDPDRRFSRALRYVDLAAEAGADCIKFQMFAPPISEDMFCWIRGDEEREPHWAESALSLASWRAVKKHAARCEIEFLASVFQRRTVEWMDALGAFATKVASRAAADYPYGKGPAPYLVSDGMHLAPERDDVIGLECEASYPSTSWWEGKLPGFSDHSGTTERAIDAMRHGCKLIEVHFYDEPGDAGPNLAASLTVAELEHLCEVRDEVHNWEIPF